MSGLLVSNRTDVRRGRAGCRWRVVVPAVDGQAEADVGIDGVESFVLLQLVGPQFVPQSDPTAFVATQVDQDSSSGLGDGAERRSELGPAVTAQRSGQVAGEAFAVQAYQRCGRRCGITHHQRQMLDPFALRVVGDRVEGADIRGQGGVSTAGDGERGRAARGQRAGRCRRGLLTPRAKCGDRDDGDVVAAANASSCGRRIMSRRSGVTISHSSAAPLRPGHLAQIHSGFGVPGTLEDSAGLGQ